MYICYGFAIWDDDNDWLVLLRFLLSIDEVFHDSLCLTMLIGLNWWIVIMLLCDDLYVVQRSNWVNMCFNDCFSSLVIQI